MIQLLVNPASGKGRSAKLLPAVKEAFLSAGHSVDVLVTKSFRDAAELAAAVAQDETGTLVVMGGDGMVHLGLNAVASQPKKLGLIPAGTGNDFYRSLGLGTTDPVAAANAIARQPDEVREVDLLQVGAGADDLTGVNTSYVGGVVATGFDAGVAGRANSMAWPRGALRYALAALAELRSFQPLPYRLTIDGRSQELEAMLVAVGNTAYYGGGMRVCPEADPTDGLLDLTIVHTASRLKLLRLLPEMFSGRFVRDPAVQQLRGRTVRVERPALVGYGDGEPLTPGPLEIEICPRLVQISGGNGR